MGYSNASACAVEKTAAPTALAELSRSIASINGTVETLAERLFSLEARTLGSPPPAPANPTQLHADQFGGAFSGLFAQLREVQQKLGSLHDLTDRLTRIA